MPENPVDRRLGERRPSEPEPLDEVDIGRPADSAEEAAAPPPERLLPLLLVAAGVLACALLAATILLFRTPRASRSASPAPGSAPAGDGAIVPSPGAVATARLPSLADSDAFARSLAAGLGSHPELTRWLGRTGLVRTVAAIVTNVADGESPRPHLDFLAPALRYRARRDSRGRLVPDPAGFAGYDAFCDAVAAVNAAASAAALRALEPLLDEAHRELGHPEPFRQSLERAIESLLAVPAVGEGPTLEPHATLLRYTDPALEALTPAQKQLLRTGPRNVRVVQDKLRELRSALAAAAAPPP